MIDIRDENLKKKQNNAKHKQKLHASKTIEIPPKHELPTFNRSDSNINVYLIAFNFKKPSGTTRLMLIFKSFLVVYQCVSHNMIF